MTINIIKLNTFSDYMTYYIVLSLIYVTMSSYFVFFFEFFMDRYIRFWWPVFFLLPQIKLFYSFLCLLFYFIFLRSLIFNKLLPGIYLYYYLFIFLFFY
jgi:hypothetical protein